MVHRVPGCSRLPGPSNGGRAFSCLSSSDRQTSLPASAAQSVVAPVPLADAFQCDQYVPRLNKHHWPPGLL